MRKHFIAVVALFMVACFALPAIVYAGEASGGAPGLIQGIIGSIFNHVDSAIIVLGVAAFALNQCAQIWAWSADSRMGRIQQLIEGAINGAYLLKGQALKKESGKLSLQQGYEMADTALDILKSDAEKAGINLDKALGDDSRKRASIQNVFDQLRARRQKGKARDDSELVAA